MAGYAWKPPGGVVEGDASLLHMDFDYLCSTKLYSEGNTKLIQNVLPWTPSHVFLHLMRRH